jgi:DNA repair exonuclease SbcCD ATPase subunit
MSSALPKESDQAIQKLENLCAQAEVLFDRLSNFIKSVDKNLAEVRKDVKENRELMREVKKNSEHVANGAYNILLAIRQNEYLQAWYPEKSTS